MPVGWRTPTGHETPTDWEVPENAYDESTSTSAVFRDIPTGDYSDWIILTHSLLYCDQLRVWARKDDYSGTIQVSAFWGESWHYAYSGNPVDGDWTVIDLGATYAVTKLRFRQKRLTQPGLVRLYEADFHEAEPPYIPPPASNVWAILSRILARAGIRLWANPYCAQSDHLLELTPKLYIRASARGDTALRKLLAMVTDGLVPREGLMFTKDLQADEEPCYEYANEPGKHAILKGEYGQALLTTHAQVSGETEDEVPVAVVESVFDWEQLIQGIDNIAMEYDPNIEETDQAQWRAEALLRHEAQKELGGQITIPVNCLGELYDVITLTDVRVGIEAKSYRVLGIRTDYDRIKGVYQQRLTLGAP